MTLHFACFCDILANCKDINLCRTGAGLAQALHAPVAASCPNALLAYNEKGRLWIEESGWPPQDAMYDVMQGGHLALL